VPRATPEAVFELQRSHPVCVRLPPSVLVHDILKGDPNRVQYACFTGPLLPAGETVTWKFGLKIDKAVTYATGSVQINPEADIPLYRDGNPASAPPSLDNTTPMRPCTRFIAERPSLPSVPNFRTLSSMASSTGPGSVRSYSARTRTDTDGGPDSC